MNAEVSTPLLSICIPTFNRAELVSSLAGRLLEQPGDFEVCVHDDGSTDDTLARLEAFADARLRVSSDVNRGRAGALIGAVSAARGRFIMPFDDDDDLTPEGLQRVLRDCSEALPPGCVGHIYHLVDQQGTQIGSSFPTKRSNFLSLRADEGVTGDKKEVVLAEALRSVLYDSRGRYRRTPTSLFWSRLALKHDVLCHNVGIGRKHYLPEGMSHNVKRLKRESAYPQLLLKIALLQGFLQGRYHSVGFLLRAALSGGAYAALAVRDLLRRSWLGHA